MATRRARREELFGVEEPRLFTRPLRKLTPKTSRGFEVIAFAEDILGLTLTPWQKWLYVHALELLPDGHYRFRTIIILIARQNGKTTWVQVLALWAMYVDGCKLVLGTAQNLETSEECWKGAVDIALGIPELSVEVASVDKTNGKKALVLETGERYKVAAASRRGGRGASGDLVILDELREHQAWDSWAAITKTTMARRDGLIVGLSNAGDAMSVVLAHQRETAIKQMDSGEDSTLALFEWSAPDDCDLGDMSAWAQANPSLGYTGLTVEAIAAAVDSDPEPIFRTEVLCQWVLKMTPAALPTEKWAKCLDEESSIPEGAYMVFGVDMSWDRSTTHVSVAGYREDGLPHVEELVANPGSTWLREWMQERVLRWSPLAIVVQGSSAPASSLLPDLEGLGVPVHKLTGPDIGKACGLAFDLISEEGLRHIGQEPIDVAVATAVSNPVGNAWALDRIKSPSDISGLVAGVEALWVLNQLAGSADYAVASSVY